MMLCFIDESGSPTSPKLEEVFVTAAVVIPVSAWQELDEKIQSLKERFSLAGCELHAACLYDEYEEQAKIPDFDVLDPEQRRSRVQAVWKKLEKAEGNPSWLKDRRRDRGPYVHLARSERLQFLKEAAGLLVNHRDVSVLCAASEMKQFSKHKEHSPLLFNFNLIQNWFEELLKRTSNHKTCGFGGFARRLLRIPPVYGLMVHDETQQERLVQTYSQLSARVAGIAKRKSLIGPSPLFVDSKLTSLVQLADLCAFGVRINLQDDDPTLFDEFESALEDAMHYCGQRKCDCRICSRWVD